MFSLVSGVHTLLRLSINLRYILQIVDNLKIMMPLLFKKKLQHSCSSLEQKLNPDYSHTCHTPTFPEQQKDPWLMILA